MIQVRPEKIRYRDPSEIPWGYTDKMDKAYNRMAIAYDLFLALFPRWKRWIKSVIPYLQGKKILEVSFGNGYLMTQYADEKYEVYGIDYNEHMLRHAEKKTQKLKAAVHLSQGNVEALPYDDDTFDTVINTMAFTGYPNGDKALSEMNRVLKPGGRLLLVDFDYPVNRNLYGYLIVRFWEYMGDVMKDILFLIQKHGFEVEDSPIGAFGSVHLFVATKPS